MVTGTPAANVHYMNRKGERIIMAVILVAVSLVLFAAFVAPYLVNRPVDPVNVCKSNLRQIDGAVQGWAIENHKDTNAVPTWNDILPYIKKALKCPSGGTYTLGSPSRMPTCSIREHNIE